MDLDTQYEEAKLNLERLLQSEDAKASKKNEARTRQVLIDTMIYECLGWGTESVFPEEHHGKDYADYTFYAPRKLMILEAKKEGKYFEIPAPSKSTQRKLSTLCDRNSELKQALQQVSDYCQKRGTPYGVVSNGHQYIGFIASRTDGVAPMDGVGVVFTSLEEIFENFEIFWNLFSKPAVEEKFFEQKLTDSAPPPLPAKLSSKISPYPGVKSRNSLQADIEVIEDAVFEDTMEAEELRTVFLQECYCQSGAVSQHVKLARFILENRYSSIFEENTVAPHITPATTKKGVDEDILALNKRPILLLGDVGVGKSIFIENLIHIAAKDIFSKTINLKIDLGVEAALSSSVRDFIIKEIPNKLLEVKGIDVFDRGFVNSTYFKEIQRFKRGIYGELEESNPTEFLNKKLIHIEDLMKDKSSHLRASLEYIVKSQQRPFVLFLDNADQRDESVQEEAFLISQEMANSWPVTVFLSVRPETYNRSRKVGALTGYHPKAFTIPPPRVTDVASKRLAFGEKIVDGKIPVNMFNPTSTVTLSNLGNLIHALRTSLSKNTEIAEFIENISGGNVREALRYIREFLSSGHVDTRKILDIIDKKGNYLVPTHEFERAIIYEDNEHYYPSSTPITNLFHIRNWSLKDYFLNFNALSVCESLSSNQDTNGFCGIGRLFDEVQELGFTPESIDQTLLYLIDRGLIETAGRLKPIKFSDIPSHIRITSSGAYHLNTLSKRFTYLDAIIVDTVILCESKRAEIKNAYNISDRLIRSRIFLNYLNDVWEEVMLETKFFDWTLHANAIEAHISDVESRLTQAV